MMMHVIEYSGMLIGGAGIVAQTIPVIPEDFKSWPITAICGFIAVAAMSLKTYETKIQTKAIDKMADRIADVVTGIAVSTEQDNERNRRMDETNSKLGNLVTQLATTNERLNKQG